MTTKKYNSLSEFYPFYLSEHQDTTSRVLHFIGTGLFFTIVIYAFLTGKYAALFFAPLAGYGFAWIGHFFFEKNKPATFEYPLYSLISDFKLFFHLLTGKQKFKAN